MAANRNDKLSYITTITHLPNGNLVISDGNTNFGEYNNGYQILSALKNEAKRQQIDFGLTTPLMGLFATPLATKFMVQKNADIALQFLKKNFGNNKIIESFELNNHPQKLSKSNSN